VYLQIIFHRFCDTQKYIYTVYIFYKLGKAEAGKGMLLIIHSSIMTDLQNGTDVLYSTLTSYYNSESLKMTKIAVIQ